MTIHFEDRIEYIDSPTLLPYDGMYQCYTDRDGVVVFHGDQADFLWELEHGRNGVECIGANWYDFHHALKNIYEAVEIVDWTSSAGDWMLAFRSDNGRWLPAWQENMYPTRGYRWSISHEWSGKTVDELLAAMEAATWPVGDVWDDIPALQKGTRSNTMPYKLKIEQDTDLDGLSPRDWDNMGHMVCWHNRYNLGDEQRRDDVNEWLRELACSLDSSLEERLLYWEDGDGWTRLMNKASEPIAASDNKIKDLVMAVIDKRTVMLPLYLYDHSGLTMNTGGYSCPWDSGQVGYIYATRDTILKEFSAKRLTAKLRKKVENILRSEVKTYAQYLEGDVYGYVIYKIDEPCDCDPEPWNDYPPCDCTKHAGVVESCWGYYGSDVALEEGKSVLKCLEDKDKE